MGHPVVHFEIMGKDALMDPEEVMPGLDVGLVTDPEGHMVGVVTQA